MSKRFAVQQSGAAFLIRDGRDSRVIALSKSKTDAATIAEVLNHHWDSTQRSKTMVRAKFVCTNIVADSDASGQPCDTGRTFFFEAVTADSEENKSWSKWTPSGRLEMYVTNPDAFNQFQQGQEYFLDFTPCGVQDAAQYEETK